MGKYTPIVLPILGLVFQITCQLVAIFNPKIDMQKKVTLDGFGVRADPREHFVKNATLNKNQL